MDGIIRKLEHQGAQKTYGYTERSVAGSRLNILVPHELPDEENKILGILRCGGGGAHPAV